VRPYVIRRNPGTGRWVLYAWLRWSGQPGFSRSRYVIIGNMDTLASAIEGVYE
jgi:hypothetical protein